MLYALLLFLVSDGLATESSEAQSCPSQSSPEYHKYCIVGAGPAGVQLGHFLQSASRDYVILERASAAASWFAKFPVHRTLNSINRRFTRSGSLEFNLRHDWNSLLGAESSIGLFGKWSREYWPPADTLVNYINAFAAPQLEARHLRFGHNVISVEATQNDSTERYILTVARDAVKDIPDCPSNKSRSLQFSCAVLVMANGMWKPRQVTDWIDGLNDVAVRYDKLAGIPLDHFENRSVLILGAGNAATETADAVRDVARDIQIISRSDEMKFMRRSKYAGDVRGRRNTIQDAFHFKSYEAATELCSGEHCKVAMVPCGPDADNLGFQDRPPVCLFEVVQSEDGKDCVVLAPMGAAFKDLVDEAKLLFGTGVYTRKSLADMRKHREFTKRMKASILPPESEGVLCMTKSALKAKMTLPQRQLLVRLRHASMEMTQLGPIFQFPYDVVITALGWVYDRSVYGRTVNIKMLRNPWRPTDTGVYPDLTSEYESVSAKHLFVAGAATHGLDRYRYKASGGFIHGFRFTVRALWRILEERYESEDHDTSQPISLDGSIQFPFQQSLSVRVPLDDAHVMGIASDLSPLWTKLVGRLNDAAGPYEMVGGSLADAVIYDCAGQAAWYIEDRPEDLFHERFVRHPRVIWSYHHGCSPCRYDMMDSEVCRLRTTASAPLSQLIHPVLQYFPPGIKPTGNTEREEPSSSHPSSEWKTLDGSRRLHLTDFHLFGEWAHPGSIRAVQIFMGHIEHAISKFCSSAGNGHVSRRFDERLDVMVDDWRLNQKLQQIENEVCPES
eukprot:TRINITY_DN33724_c0_g1_i1.p1 TRINITY_DN33724_c0_g1~~TRINITY_DN33724_c0_g1_i1.p1  ORF type:complete len:787 (-),score=96.38 TRINITY_DN33724_c0_g1_i1:163-2523(-)